MGDLMQIKATSVHQSIDIICPVISLCHAFGRIYFPHSEGINILLCLGINNEG